MVEVAPEAKTPVRRTRARKKPEGAEPLPAFAGERHRSTGCSSGATSAVEPAADAPAAEGEADAKPVRRRRVATRKTSAPDVAALDVVAVPAEEAGPCRRCPAGRGGARSRRRSNS